MSYEMIAYAHVPIEERCHIIAEIAGLFARWNEALGNPWPDLAFKPAGQDNGTTTYRAHLIGQTEWSVAALIQTVLVSGERWPKVR